MNTIRKSRLSLMMLFFWIILLVSYTEAAVASCGSPANPIEAENCLTGQSHLRMGHQRGR